MQRRSKPIVLDSWSVLAFLQGETQAEKIADLVADTQERGADVMMCVVNAGEVWYILAREVSPADADASIEDIRQMGIQIVNVDWDLTRLAAGIKKQGGLSFADAFAAALAKQHKCELVTGDREFKSVETEIKINWL
jgi:ribonuclease VapC